MENLDYRGLAGKHRGIAKKHHDLADALQYADEQGVEPDHDYHRNKAAQHIGIADHYEGLADLLGQPQFSVDSLFGGGQNDGGRGTIAINFDPI
jgi:hypothetical protein